MELTQSKAMALAEQLGYPIQETSRKPVLDPHADVLALIQRVVEDIVAIKDVALDKGEKNFKGILEWALANPEEAASRGYATLGDWAHDKLVKVLEERDAWSKLKPCILEALSALEKSIESPTDYLPVELESTIEAPPTAKKASKRRKGAKSGTQQA